MADDTTKSTIERHPFNPEQILTRTRFLLLDYIHPLADYSKRREGLVVTSTSNPAWIEGNGVYVAYCPDEQSPESWWNAIQLQYQLKGVRPKTIRFEDTNSEKTLAPFLKGKGWIPLQETALIHNLESLPDNLEKYRINWIHPSRDKQAIPDFIEAAKGGRADTGEPIEARIARSNIIATLADNPEVASCVVYHQDNPVLSGAMLRKSQAGILFLLGMNETLAADFCDNTSAEQGPDRFEEVLSAFFISSLRLAAKAKFRGLGLLSFSEIETSVARKLGFKALVRGNVWRPKPV